MGVYVVAFVDVHDIAKYKEEYVPKTLPLVTKHGGTMLAAATAKVVKEGAFPPGRIIIAHFPSLEAAEAFYSDPEYQLLIKLRQSIGTSQLGFFPGLK